MAPTRSQAASDAAPETTTERESVASETRTDKIMALLQQIVAHQIEEKRARESYQEKRQEKEQERQKREERFEVLKETVGEKLVQCSCKIDEVKEDNGGGQQQEGNEEREEEGGEMSHAKRAQKKLITCKKNVRERYKSRSRSRRRSHRRGRSHRRRRSGRRGGYVSQPRRRRSDKCWGR